MPKFQKEHKTNVGKKRKLNLANMKNHNYTRNVEDYKWLCYSCHRKMDLNKKRL